MPAIIKQSAPPAETTADIQVFFSAAQASYHQALVKRNEETTFSYNIAGWTVQLRFAGQALVPLITPALAHLSSAQLVEPDLVVRLWDSVSTGAAMPAPPWSLADYRERGEIRGYNTDRYRTFFQVGPGTLNLIDLDQNSALFWLNDAAQLPVWECGSPLLRILHPWLQRRGYQLAHAAAVGTAEGGVLLAGRGGSGKSTTALACLAAGLKYVSDDYCLLSQADWPYVHSLYNSAKLDRKSVYHFPGIEPIKLEPERLGSDKALYCLHRQYPDKLLAGFPVRAILLPKVTGGRQTELRPISPAASLAALAPSTIFQLAGAGEADFRSLSDFTRKVPSYLLELGTELSQIPAAVRQAIENGE